MTGEKIILQPPEPEDIDILYNLENDPGNWHLSNTKTPYSRFVLEQYIMNSHQDIFTAKQLRLMIRKKDEIEKGVAVGAIDLFDFDPANRRAGIGIVILKSEQKKGYAAEALKLLLDYCFHILDLHQVYCNITADNMASIRLFQKAGFKITGTKKEWIYHNQRWLDEHLLQMIHRKSPEE